MTLIRSRPRGRQVDAATTLTQGAIEGGRDYDVLLPRSRKIEISGHPVYVLDLATLIGADRTSRTLQNESLS